MMQRRVLFVTCMFAGQSLLLYGLYRWPPDFVRREYRDSRGRTRVEGQLKFERGTGLADRFLGTADFVAATLLFAAAPYLRFRKPLPESSRSPQEDAFNLLVGFVCVIEGLAAAFLSILATVRLFG